jgi:hypothetical protein
MTIVENNNNLEILNSIEETSGLDRIDNTLLTNDSIIDAWFSPLKTQFLVRIIENHLLISNHVGIWLGTNPLKTLKHLGKLSLQAL